jgi:O-antigen/teichoic acid export membrane protein
LVLGPRWLDASGIFRVLSVAAFLLPISGFRGVVFLSLGMGRPYFHLGVLNAVFVTVGFVAGLPWGPLGVAGGYVIATGLVQVPAIVYLTRTTPVTASDLLASAWRPALASVLAAALTVFCLRQEWIRGLLPQLLAGGCLFLSSYLLAFILVPGGRIELMRTFALWRHFRPSRPVG